MPLIECGNITLEGGRNLLLIGLLEETIIKSKKQTVFTTKTRCQTRNQTRVRQNLSETN